MRQLRSSGALTGFAVLFMTLALVVYSEQAFAAAFSGLKLFFEVVLPSLLPFFVLSEVLYALGMVHFLGVLLEPLMRPVFNVPGAGSFVFSMGLAAGYPMDAVLTAKFRKDRLCSKIEAERLLAFSNTADPLFIFGAVAVGMFGRPDLGMALALAHYLGTLLVGIAFRFYGARQDRGEASDERAKASLESQRLGGSHSMLRRAFRAMAEARKKDGRFLGQVLNDSIVESVTTLAKIMSFIVLFSVIVSVLQQLGVVGWLEVPVRTVLAAVGMQPTLANAIIQGFFEIDLGSAAAARATAPLTEAAMVASAIVAWSGLSVMGQVATILSGTGISLRPFVFARVLHALFAALSTPLAIRLLAVPAVSDVIPVFAPLQLFPTSAMAHFTTHLAWGAAIGAGLVGVSLVAGCVVAAVGGVGRRIVVMRWR